MAIYLASWKLRIYDEWSEPLMIHEEQPFTLVAESPLEAVEATRQEAQRITGELYPEQPFGYYISEVVRVEEALCP